MSELLIGTRKGLFTLRGHAGEAFDVVSRDFPGAVVEFAMRDARSGRTFASVTDGWYGPRVMFRDRDADEWTQAAGPEFPQDTETALERIWVVKPGEADGVLYAGVAPAALFVSEDNGESWSLNRGLWDVPTRPEWNPGAGGLALHSICPWPGDPLRMAVGISAAGVWITEDGGATWRTGYTGMVPLYMPEEMREGTHALCVHNMHRAPLRPERLFMQFHGSVYRSDDEGGSWNDIAAGLSSGFGFPLAIDPADPDRAFVIPLDSAEDRVTPQGRVAVYETRDAGTTWHPSDKGLPGTDAWLTVLRQAFGTAGEGPDLQLAFGATSGEIFSSPDGGGTWAPAFERLAPVTSVRFA